jgi:hypothetical protein
LRQFELQGEAPALGSGEKIELRAGDAAVGELTSVAHIELPGLSKTLALGIARVEALEKSETEPVTYDGGIGDAAGRAADSGENDPDFDPCRENCFMDEKEPTFTVTDRRKFTLDGALRDDAPVTSSSRKRSRRARHQ